MDNLNQTSFMDTPVAFITLNETAAMETTLNESSEINTDTPTPTKVNEVSSSDITTPKHCSTPIQNQHANIEMALRSGKVKK